MNRSLVLLVAMAVLVAHSLALRTDATGALAPPYDQAFVAFRVARNLVFEGTWTWSPGVPGFDSHPSTLWVLIGAAVERFSLPINAVMRGIGIVSAAATLMLTGAFHPDRAASLVVPMLLAISGAMAAAAVSGTETALLTLLLTGSFLAFERRADVSLGVLTLLAGWTHGEAWVFVGVLLLLRLLARLRPEDGRPAPTLWPFAVPAVGLGLLTLLRVGQTGEALSPFVRDLVETDPGRLRHGLATVRDGLVSCASPLLVVHALWYLLRGQLSPTGRRALVLAATWLATVVLGGGGGLPFAEDIVPALPILLLAGQEGLIHALNSWKAPVRGIAWVTFLGAVLASTVASVEPRDIGPLPTAGLMRAWLKPTAAPRHGREGALGRRGLLEEEAATRYLREIGIFLRDEVDPRSRVLTPFPGSIAYLSGLPVEDLLGRATAAAPRTRPSHTGGPRRIDALAALAGRPEHIVPFCRPRAGEALVEAFLGDLAQLDVRGSDPERQEALRAALADYEVVTIPLQRRGRENPALREDRARLLRLRGERAATELEAHLDGEGRLSVLLEHHGHAQLADLEVVVVDAAGAEWSLSPTGRPAAPGEELAMRSDLLLGETGDRPVHLVSRAPLLLGGIEGRELRVELVSPGESGGDPAARLADPVLVPLP
jgi:hypothetical protein